jgi:hypothetical protein
MQFVNDRPLVNINREHRALTPRYQNPIRLRRKAHTAQVDHLFMLDVPLCQAAPGYHVHAF